MPPLMPVAGTTSEYWYIFQYPISRTIQVFPVLPVKLNDIVRIIGIQMVLLLGSHNRINS